MFETFVSGLLHVPHASFKSYKLFSGGVTCRREYTCSFTFLMFDLITNVLVLRLCYKPEKFKCIRYKRSFAEVVAE